MKIKNLILTSILTISCLITNAQLFGTVSQFTQVQKDSGVITASVPLGVQYGIDYNLGTSKLQPKVFAAFGASHIFNGETNVINNLPLIGGLAINPSSSVPNLSIGAGVGANLINGQFIAGFTAAFSITPLIAGGEVSKKKSTHKFGITL